MLKTLLERIGLKPLPDREKLKEDYSLLQSSSFQVEIAITCQLSTVNCQLSTENLNIPIGMLPKLTLGA